VTKISSKSLLRLLQLLYNPRVLRHPRLPRLLNSHPLLHLLRLLRGCLQVAGQAEVKEADGASEEKEEAHRGVPEAALWQQLAGR